MSTTTTLDQFGDQLIEQGRELEKEKESLLARIGSNRDMLRNLMTTNSLRDEQIQTVNKMYPPRQKKADEPEQSSDGAQPAPEPAPDIATAAQRSHGRGRRS